MMDLRCVTSSRVAEFFGNVQKNREMGDASRALSKIVLIFSILCCCSKNFVFKFGARSMTNDNDASHLSR